MADTRTLFRLPALKYLTYLFFLPALRSFPGYTIAVIIGNEPRSKLPAHLCWLKKVGSSETIPPHIHLFFFSARTSVCTCNWNVLYCNLSPSLQFGTSLIINQTVIILLDDVFQWFSRARGM